VCLCDLLYVLFLFRLEQLEFRLLQAYGLLHINKNWFDSFQGSHLGNSLCELDYKICLSVKLYLFVRKFINFMKGNWKTDISRSKILWCTSKIKNNWKHFIPNSIEVISSRQLEHVIGNPHPATFWLAFHFESQNKARVTGTNKMEIKSDSNERG
jgi:hypothetical protein